MALYRWRLLAPKPAIDRAAVQQSSTKRPLSIIASFEEDWWGGTRLRRIDGRRHAAETCLPTWWTLFRS
jgi:hypothetical protein